MTQFSAQGALSNRDLPRIEAFLNNFDIDSDELSFKQLGGTTPTNWMVIKNDRPVANLKCTRKNTFHKGAIVAYELGKILGFNIFPVARIINVNRTIKYSYKTDEGVKKTTTIDLDEECVLKEWSEKFAPYYWKEEEGVSTFSNPSSSKRLLVNQLSCSNELLSDINHKFYSLSVRGNPDADQIESSTEKVKYFGESPLLNVSQDFSNLMVIDVLIGQDDRFPGGNLHFRSLSGEYSVTTDKTVHFDSPQLFSLDNESSLRGKPSKAQTHFENFISRFDESMIQKIRDLRDELEIIEDDFPIQGRLSFLDFNTWKTKIPVKDLLVQNIDIILKHVAKSEKRCGYEQTYF
jgi:hypothetical protein